MKNVRKRPMHILLGLAIISLLSIVLSYFEAIVLTTPFRFITQQFPSDIKLENYDEVTFKTADNLLLNAWYVSPTREDGASILFVHGVSGNKAQFLPEAELFSGRGYGILLLELRAHGYSEGDMTGMGLWETQDVEAAFDFLVQQPEVNPERIALYGHSMGGAIAIHSAPLVDIRVLLLDAPFADLREAIRGDIEFYGVPALFFPELILNFASSRTGLDYDEAGTVDTIRSIEVPIFLMHGTLDDQVPLEQAYWLYEAANEPKVLHIVEGAGHGNTYETDPKAYQALMIPFLEQYLINN
jgi:uncharacterized protein